ncbi:glycosyltransferase [Epibacterium sp. DP7N7-1]|nr:glycosyltransferase [Epibacterium sp. DP7N7-1]
MLDSTLSDNSSCLIFMPARNCEMFAAEAIRSVSRQTMDDVFILYVDDASEDQTGDIAQHYLKELFPGRHAYIRNDTRIGKSHNIWKHLRPRADEAEFIGILDADDQLADMTILDKLAQRYGAGKDVVWTNYFMDNGHRGMNAALDPELSPRKQRWSTSHFFSFRAALLKNIPESYYKDQEGNWFQGACDVALALPILDQTRNYEFIPTPAYRYTSSNHLSLHNSTPKVNAITSKIQLQNSNQVFAKPPLPLFTNDKVEESVSMHQPDTTATHSAAPLSTDIWSEKAAQLLIARHPTLLSAQAICGADHLSALQLWSISELLQSASGECLFIGAPDTALILTALAKDTPEIHLTCLVEEKEDAPYLRARLALLGLSEQTKVISGPHAKVEMNQQSCSFPACTELEGHSPLSLIVVDGRASENEEIYTAIALPAVSDHLAERSFHFCALTGEVSTAQKVATTLGQLTVGLEFCTGALGGTGLVCFPANQE